MNVDRQTCRAAHRACRQGEIELAGGSWIKKGSRDEFDRWKQDDIQ